MFKYKVTKPMPAYNNTVPDSNRLAHCARYREKRSRVLALQTGTSNAHRLQVKYLSDRLYTEKYQWYHLKAVLAKESYYLETHFSQFHCLPATFSYKRYGDCDPTPQKYYDDEDYC